MMVGTSLMIVATSLVMVGTSLMMVATSLVMVATLVMVQKLVEKSVGKWVEEKCDGPTYRPTSKN